MSIFGAIVTGRMVQTDFQNVDQTKFLINIPDPDSINHIVVFLTGAQPFPDGFGGSVYFCWPSPDAVGNWQLLGFISNTKPSAIFRISKHKTESTQLHAFSAHGFSSVAQLGISVEPLDQIQFQAPASGDATAATSQTEFCTKMAESLFNHLASYAGSVTVPTHPNENFFPLRALEQWYSNFRRRLEQNPNFWKGATS